MVAFSIDLGITTILTSNNVITQLLPKKKKYCEKYVVDDEWFS